MTISLEPLFAIGDQLPDNSLNTEFQMSCSIHYFASIVNINNEPCIHFYFCIFKFATYKLHNKEQNHNHVKFRLVWRKLTHFLSRVFLSGSIITQIAIWSICIWAGVHAIWQVSHCDKPSYGMVSTFLQYLWIASFQISGHVKNPWKKSLGLVPCWNIARCSYQHSVGVQQLSSYDMLSWCQSTKTLWHTPVPTSQ